jgi:hypothetical protein
MVWPSRHELHAAPIHFAITRQRANPAGFRERFGLGIDDFIGGNIDAARLARFDIGASRSTWTANAVQRVDFPLPPFVAHIEIVRIHAPLLSCFLRALRKVFKWAVKQEYMATNPARDIEYISRD